MPQLTWLITGCSSGIGEQFVYSLLQRGERVIATARSASCRLVGLKEAGAAILDLDVTASQADLETKANESIAIYGTVDVLVNNAGYTESGMVEEVSHERFLRQFNTNTFGVLNTTRAFLPHFRAKRAGVLVFVGSVGGASGEAGAGAYCGSKFAVEGIFECLRKETMPLGIQSVLFELGFFQTKSLDPANLKSEKPFIKDYEEMNKLANEFVRTMNGNQTGDTEKAVRIIIDVVKDEGVATGKSMPERLPLGADSLGKIRDKYAAYLDVCKEWEDVITSTDRVTDRVIS